jgi:hypothetical protein
VALGQAYKIGGTPLAPTDIGAEPTLTKGSLTESGPASVLTIVGGTDAVIGTGTAIEVKQAGSGQDGYLSSVDWTTFNAKAARKPTPDTVAGRDNVTDLDLKTLGSIGVGSTGALSARLDIRGAGTGAGFALKLQDADVDKLVVLIKATGIGTTSPL